MSTKERDEDSSTAAPATPIEVLIAAAKLVAEIDDLNKLLHIMVIVALDNEESGGAEVRILTAGEANEAALLSELAYAVEAMNSSASSSSSSSSSSRVTIN